MDGLLVGRFQPFHLGHIQAIDFALEHSGMVWLGIGSSNIPPESNNPFTAAERQTMIESSLDSTILERIRIYHIPDHDDHKKWMQEIDKIVPKYEVVFSNDSMTQHLYGRAGTKIMPIPLTRRDVLSGTHIRRLILDGKDWQDLVPKGTRLTLDRIGARARLAGI